MEKTSKWSQEYKDSIDCSDPKGFSQRAHCQGLKKKKEKSAEDTLHELHTAAIELEELGFVKEASVIHEEFIKLSRQTQTVLTSYWRNCFLKLCLWF